MLFRFSRMKNTRSSTLRQYISDQKLRLSDADRAFLSDLAVVRIIDESDADSHHFQGRKTKSSRRLDKLCDSGLLECKRVFQPGRGEFKAYTFKTDKIASLFGGKRPSIGAKRNALHECITSRLFFAEGRPDSFILEADFSKSQKDLFRVGQGVVAGREICLPDALYVSNGGEIVVVEADSGQYTKSQIRAKQAAWVGMKQVWGQPNKAFARVTDGSTRVHNFE